MRELLQSSAREALGEQTEIDTIGLPENWMKAEQSSHYYDTGMQLGDLLASDINSNLPQLYWESWAKDPAVASSFRKELVRATWFRAKLLGKDNVLNDEMQKCFPAIAADISTYKNVANSDEKRFVLSCLILKNRRMSPFAKPVPPTLDEFNYYRQNFWLPAPVSEKERLAQRASAPATGTPYPENASEIWKCPAIFTGTDRVATLLESYDKPVVRNLLNSNELRQLNEERSALAKQDPAEFVCAPVIRWAKTHQSDPRVPEMLYRCVKFPLWRAGAKTGW